MPQEAISIDVSKVASREVANKSCITKRRNIKALIYKDLMLSHGCVGDLFAVSLGTIQQTTITCYLRFSR